MNFAYAGTPEFGALVLEELLRMGRVPRLVLTQPPRPAGRGRTLRASAVASAARDHKLPLLETEDVNDETTAEALRSARISTLVVAAFGQMLRASVLDAYECINVHASLLPAYRGAAPVARALMAGETETGVCIMKMTPGLDEGPVAARTSVGVGRWDDRATLERLLALTGASAVAHVLDSLAGGYVQWTPQEGASSYAGKIGAVDRALDLSDSAGRAHDRVRALSPTPGASLTFADLHLKVTRSWPFEAGASGPGFEADDRPGRVAIEAERLFVGCGKGRLELLECQAQGKKVMAAADFLRGYGPRLGSTAH